MEKRREGRLDTASEIELRAGDVTLGRGSVTNLSEGGVFVAYLDRDIFVTVREGAALEFTFFLPTGQVSGTATVAWKKPEEGLLGLRFERVEGQESLPHLLGYLYSAFCGLKPPN